MTELQSIPEGSPVRDLLVVIINALMLPTGATPADEESRIRALTRRTDAIRIMCESIVRCGDVSSSDSVFLSRLMELHPADYRLLRSPWEPVS